MVAETEAVVSNGACGTGIAEPAVRRLDCGAGKVGGPRISSGTTISLIIAAAALLGLGAFGVLVLEPPPYGADP